MSKIIDQEDPHILLIAKLSEMTLDPTQPWKDLKPRDIYYCVLNVAASMLARACFEIELGALEAPSILVASARGFIELNPELAAQREEAEVERPNMKLLH